MPLPVARILPPKFPNFFQQSGQARQEEERKGAPPSFSLPLAIALAGSAFEAYLEPTGAEGFRLHTWPNKSDVTFADSCDNLSPHALNSPSCSSSFTKGGNSLVSLCRRHRLRMRGLAHPEVAHRFKLRAVRKV
eukprot:1151952-Pelagomonas_calceolata.AAC.1